MLRKVSTKHLVKTLHCFGIRNIFLSYNVCPQFFLKRSLNHGWKKNKAKYVHSCKKIMNRCQRWIWFRLKSEGNKSLTDGQSDHSWWVVCTLDLSCFIEITYNIQHTLNIIEYCCFCLPYFLLCTERLRNPFWVCR